MEIPEKPPLFAPQTNTLFKDDAHGVAASEPDGSRTENDTVDLSADANQIREMVNKVNNLSDVRAQKVAELKHRIASGTYQILNEKVASRLIGETVENNTLINHMDTLDD